MTNTNSSAASHQGGSPSDTPQSINRNWLATIVASFLTVAGTLLAVYIGAAINGDQQEKSRKEQTKETLLSEARNKREEAYFNFLNEARKCYDKIRYWEPKRNNPSIAKPSKSSWSAPNSQAWKIIPIADPAPNEPLINSACKDFNPSFDKVMVFGSTATKDQASKLSSSIENAFQLKEDGMNHWIVASAIPGQIKSFLFLMCKEIPPILEESQCDRV